MHSRYRPARLALALLLGSVAVLAMMTMRNPGGTMTVLPGSHARAGALRDDVQMLAGTIGERNVWTHAALQRASGYIAQAFRTLGYGVTLQPYAVAGKSVDNIEAALAGTSIPDEVVLIGAHYDSVRGSPGADDNATGVAAVLELARRFAGRRQLRTLRFVAFVNEEPPFFQTPLMGSLVYANAARDRGDRITAMLSLETIGYYSDAPDSQTYPAPVGVFYPRTGDFIGFVSNVGSARLLFRARRAFRHGTSFPFRSAAVPAAIPGVGWSDHWAFWQAGYPAMMVTDTAPYRYPWYHTAEDTPDKVSPDRLAHVVDGLEHVVSALAGGDAPSSK
jgi:Zn-dependent M28 family amino/carboxypeptidase